MLEHTLDIRYDDINAKRNFSNHNSKIQGCQIVINSVDLWFPTYFD